MKNECPLLSSIKTHIVKWESRRKKMGDKETVFYPRILTYLLRSKRLIVYTCKNCCKEFNHVNAKIGNKFCCKTCMVQFKKKNDDTFAIRYKKWKKDDYERHKVQRQLSSKASRKIRRAAKLPEKRYPEIIKKSYKRCMEKLSDGYIKSLLTAHGSPLCSSDIPAEIVELKRQHIQAKRLIKNGNK